MIDSLPRHDRKTSYTLGYQKSIKFEVNFTKSFFPHFDNFFVKENDQGYLKHRMHIFLEVLKVENS